MSRDEFEDEGEGLGIVTHIPSIIMQRKWLLIIPVILGAVAGVAVAFLMPTVYRSQAVLLVESSLLPEDVVGEGSPDIVDQRIARIKQQVLSRPDLIEMIQKIGLYPDERASTPLSEIIEKMRDATKITPQSAEIQNRGGRNNSTIAFSLSFDYPDAGKAQEVAQDFVERVLQIDSTRNAERAKNTVEFLTDQENDLQSKISQLEDQISQVKARNGLALSARGMTMLGTSTGSYDTQIASLQRDNSQLTAQLALADSSTERDPVVVAAESQLAAAKAVYSDTHPDVIKAKQRLAEAKQLAASNAEKQPTDTIKAQIAFNKSQIQELQRAKAEEQSRVNTLMAAQSRGPAVEQEVSQLQQRLDGLNGQSERVKSRLLEAQASAKAEDEQKSERLTLVDPPVVPDQPFSPNRPKLMALGLGGGLALGLFLVMALEFFLRPIRGLESVKATLGEMPMVAIPTIRYHQKEPWYKRLNFLRWRLRTAGQT